MHGILDISMAFKIHNMHFKTLKFNTQSNISKLINSVKYLPLRDLSYLAAVPFNRAAPLYHLTETNALVPRHSHFNDEILVRLFSPLSVLSVLNSLFH